MEGLGKEVLCGNVPVQAPAQLKKCQSFLVLTAYYIHLYPTPWVRSSYTLLPKKNVKTTNSATHVWRPLRDTITRGKYLRDIALTTALSFHIPQN